MNIVRDGLLGFIAGLLLIIGTNIGRIASDLHTIATHLTNQ